MTQKANTSAAPFTPSERNAQNPLLHRAANARLEALLTKHAPEVFLPWAADKEAEGQGREVNPIWGASLLFMSTALATWNYDPALYSQSDRTRPDNPHFRRHQALLFRLVLKGVRVRGEA